MNGVVEILIDDKLYTFRFNVQSCMLFQQKGINNAMNPESSENQIKLMGDLFYCGLYGQAMREQRQALTYGEAMDLFDLFSQQDSFIDDTARLWDEWKKSKWGSELVSLVEEGKKKREEQLNHASSQQDK